MGVPSDDDVARLVAEGAGAALLELRDQLGFDDPQRLRDEGDQASHRVIMRMLKHHRPDDPVLSEEGVDDPARHGAPRVWIIDPLDGTREFGEAGRGDWAVHVALVEGEETTVAAVALPAHHEVFTSAPPPARRDHASEPMRLIVSRSHTPPEAVAIADRIGAELVRMGSAGAKTMAVVRGDADAYVHLGGQYEWDSAAPVGVATAAGLSATRADGSPLRYNQLNPWLPDQIVCLPELHAQILAAVRDVLDGAGNAHTAASS